MSIWWALFFMTLGGLIVGFFDWRAWNKYYEGRNESQGLRSGPKGR